MEDGTASENAAPPFVVFAGFFKLSENFISKTGPTRRCLPTSNKMSDVTHSTRFGDSDVNKCSNRFEHTKYRCTSHKFVKLICGRKLPVTADIRRSSSSALSTCRLDIPFRNVSCILCCSTPDNCEATSLSVSGHINTNQGCATSMCMCVCLCVVTRISSGDGGSRYRDQRWPVVESEGELLDD